MINVTQPFLPEEEEYKQYIEGIWERKWLTNNGPLVNELELRLKKFLGLSHLLFVTNGTIALQFAIRGLELKGEIITTPFSYVATTSSIVWENCNPIFVDIEANSLNIDPLKIEGAITDKTQAILATHVYGNPCDIDAIQRIADNYNLKVIYDAAHCFGTKYKGKSVLEYGDISTISFHATKLFHTIEGGAVVTKDPQLLKKIAFLRNFGHNGPESFQGVGINGKNSEFHAAMGLANLPYANDILEKRKQDHHLYNSWLKKLELQDIFISDDATYNYSYYPILFDSEEDCIKVFQALERSHIFARRYFYPLLSSLNYVNQMAMPIAENISKRILCLPLYYYLSNSEIDMICRIILRTLKY
ncbi:DegT/DnrJ/EryC1/StrS family aminotransferase [Xanthovirga aplysinae]|uniref:DegT/DnrJ/EryC1/StrS family aminotransferase n=1 Tax=Xanthovirga aplysinae TaxID=2529853 RepID=UPI0012BD6A9A|nr:DegT/DnrJ/EryC1/StrS family aminotransferase [Xanthovirga aplysinae]MTI32263.1 DegT/DnrJ/EryC1/StrS family aminotransferase [Xanthovirga aplysinae]